MHRNSSWLIFIYLMVLFIYKAAYLYPLLERYPEIFQCLKVTFSSLFIYSLLAVLPIRCWFSWLKLLYFIVLLPAILLCIFLSTRHAVAKTWGWRLWDITYYHRWNSRTGHQCKHTELFTFLFLIYHKKKKTRFIRHYKSGIV